MQLSRAIFKRILRFQQDEISGSILFEKIAQRQKKEANKAALLKLAGEERSHYDVWKVYTGRDIGPDWPKIFFYDILCRILGTTFTYKFLEKNEDFVVRELMSIEKEIPEARMLIDDEESHENRFMEMVDEERLHYMGSMVLGLNDALVELTGTIAGLTFALANTRIVALSGIITGVSATLSMAASNYLAERANGNARAITSSMYTGAAYLVTVALMVLPYLLLPGNLYILAFIIMLAVVVFIILIFNYYISMVQSLPFWKRFAEMAALSIGVAAVSFAIGLLAKKLIGVDL